MRLCVWRWRPGTSEAAKVKQARGVWSISVAARVRQQPRTRLTPIVMLTSSSLPIDVTRAFDAGANSYVA